jgi:DNA-binding CsgD family transcriptional regulator
VPDPLIQGSESYERRAWREAYDSLSQADERAALGVENLERLANAAYLIGRDDEFLKVMDRAHRAHLEAGDKVRAARCAFWLGLTLLFRGEPGQATGWLGRAQRLVEGQDCAEQGYLLLPVAEQQLATGEFAAAFATASNAAALGERFVDTDLIAIARHLQGRARVQQGQIATGLALLDEAMLAVTAGELSPIMTGLVYCSVIDACQQVYALGRAREWTAALAQWCERQPGMVAFTGACLVHRAEIMQLRGAWPDAIAEAQRACVRPSGTDLKPPAAGFYQQGEVHRLRGAFTEAETAYAKASQQGLDPQPGFALLRLAQGRTDAAAAAIRRAVATVTDPWQRARLLPAHVEIMLAAADLPAAQAACAELEQIARRFDIEVLTAIAAQARGALQLAEGDAGAALTSLRRALPVWLQAETPYMTARVRALIGLACRALGDEDGCALELAAARAAFEQLGATPDVARIEALLQRAAMSRDGGLSPRELQVLRLVATGKSNKTIARELSLSGKTVDRHLSNIFTKLDVTSRAAATAYAFKHDLI